MPSAGPNQRPKMFRQACDHITDAQRILRVAGEEDLAAQLNKIWHQIIDKHDNEVEVDPS